MEALIIKGFIIGIIVGVILLIIDWKMHDE